MTAWRSSLNSKIEERTARIAVIGLGYVGLPLASGFVKAGFPVVGIDNDPSRLDRLRSDRLVPTGLELGADPDPRADVYVICVPTPLEGGTPDLSFVTGAARSLAPVLRAGTLVVLESTTYPGTTEGLFRHEIETSGLIAGRDLALAYSPERIDPGNDTYGLGNVPKLVAGLTPPCTDVAAALYRTVAGDVVELSSPRVAEMSKLIENTYRQVNISLMNEFAMVAHELDVDIWESIDGASTKPFGFHAFRPGIGIGGHCIAVDPVYLTHRIRELGRPPFRLVELAREVDDSMPRYIVGRIRTALAARGIDIEGARILLLGLTYKADVADMRESRALQVMSGLEAIGANVSYHDPFHEEATVEGRTYQRSDLDEGIGAADMVAILTAHSSYDWRSIAQRARSIFDARGVTRGLDGADIEQL